MARTPHTSDNKPIIAGWPTEGSRKTILTHDWTDKTTWYSDAARVENQNLAAVVSGTTYSFPQANIIDLYHAKIWEEDEKTDNDGYSYRVSVEVNVSGTWDLKTEVNPHTDEGDYTVDYAAGTLTFDPTVDVEAQVRATYYYAQSSKFTVTPDEGKILKLTSAEVQFGQDIVINDTTLFITYGYVISFAPQYAQSNGGPYPDYYKIEIHRTTYKGIRDFLNESNGSRQAFPALSAGNWRGIPVPVVVFQWDYAAVLQLESSKGMELIVSLENDEPMGGSYSTATLYALSTDEP